MAVAPYRVVSSSLDLKQLDFSKNYVLKTATGGYDGHGQVVIRTEADLEKANQLAHSTECVLEEFVSFDREISVIISGNGKEVTVFPVQENSHRNNILSKTIVPARISEALSAKAQAMAVKIAEQLNLLELFVWKCLWQATRFWSMKLPHAPTTLGIILSKPVIFHSLTPIF